MKKETSSESALGEEGRQNPGADAETALINAMSKWPAPARTSPEVGIPPRSLLGVSGEYRNMLYRDYRGIIFPYSLLRTSKQ